MKRQKDTCIPCVVRRSAIGFARRSGITDTDPDGCTVLDSARKLMALGLSADEIDELDIRQPMLQAICEYARLDDSGGSPRRAADAVDATLKIIGDQIENLDLEIEMLDLRRQALGRRTVILRKLADSLGTGDRGLRGM